MAKEQTIDANYLNNQHNTAYYALRPKWVDLINLYEPQPGILGAYVRRHPSEDDAEYIARQKFACQVNAMKVIIEFYRSMLFSGDPRITAKKHEDKVKAIEKRATLHGDSLKEFLADTVWPQGALFGNVDIFADSPSEVATSFADQQDRDLQPYLFTVQPLNRVRWQCDDGGNYTLYQSEDKLNTEIASQTQIKDNTQWQMWTEKYLTIYKKDGTVLKQDPNPYGFVPAVCFVPMNSVRYVNDAIGVSLVDDQLDLQRELLNTMSLISDYHRSVNFAQYTIIQDMEQGDVPTEGELAEMGNHRGMVLKGKGSDAKFVTPSPEGVKAMTEYTDKLLDWMFTQALVPIDANTIKTHTSEKGIRANQSQLFNRLTKIAKNMERSTKRMIELALKVQGVNPAEAEVSVQWDTNFSYEAFINAIETVAAFRTAMGDISELAVKELAKRTISSELYATGKMDEIEAEIDKWEQPDPVVANPAANPGSQIDSNEALVLQKSNEGISQASKIENSQ